MVPPEYREWYRKNDCDHGHCPYHCEHPQPQMVDGVLVCGRCLVKDEIVTPMEPCTPKVCGD